MSHATNSLMLLENAFIVQKFQFPIQIFWKFDIRKIWDVFGTEFLAFELVQEKKSTCRKTS